MKQAANIGGIQQGGLLPGVLIKTSATDFAPIEQLQLMRFKGERWSCSARCRTARPPATSVDLH